MILHHFLHYCSGLLCCTVMYVYYICYVILRFITLCEYGSKKLINNLPRPSKTPSSIKEEDTLNYRWIPDMT